MNIHTFFVPNDVDVNGTANTSIHQNDGQRVKNQDVNCDKTIVANISDDIVKHIQNENVKKKRKRNEHIRFPQLNKTGIKKVVDELNNVQPDKREAMKNHIDLFEFKTKGNCIDGVLEERKKLSIELQEKYGFVTKYKEQKNSKKTRSCKDDTNHYMRKKIKLQDEQLKQKDMEMDKLLSENEQLKEKWNVLNAKVRDAKSTLDKC